MRPKTGPISAQGLRQRLNERFRGPLMSFFLRRVRDPGEAEDLTHDVFIRLLAAAERQPIADVEALVFVTAGNLLKDRGRKASRRADAAPGAIDAAAVSEITREFVEDRDPERVLLARESFAEVLAALNELNPRTRDIYVLFRLENMKQKEIAALYGIARSTVEKEVMRATLHLALRCGGKAP
ncbi:MAG TPA: sigma-70 family RNA polymerase sigma factor [Caulobacteraceae bacterium]